MPAEHQLDSCLVEHRDEILICPVLSIPCGLVPEGRDVHKAYLHRC